MINKGSFFLAACLVGCSQLLFGQADIPLGGHFAGVGDWQQHDHTENIQVVPLSSDRHASSFLIRVNKAVPVHYHAAHSESIMVLSGSGKMLLGVDTIHIKPGDFVAVPEGIHHGVWTTSEEALEVISIQAPYFDGGDRVWVDKP